MQLGVPWLQTLLIVVLVLRFDGSVRRLRDPGFPTDHLASTAACSAVLLDDKDRIIAIGGSLIDSNVLSVEAEYEGLLLGLQQLVCLCDTENIEEPDGILIQGDCKSVIQQVQGRAKPRLLQHYYDRANTLIQQLPFPVELQHIPRGENKLCDFVAGAIVDSAQRAAYWEAWKTLSTSLEAEIANHDLVVGRSARQSDSRLGDVWEQHAASIPTSRRPLMYRRMVDMAIRHRDFDSLASIAKIMTNELESFWKKAPQYVERRKALMTEAVVMRLFGLESAGRLDKAKALRRKHRASLDGHSQEVAALWSSLEMCNVTAFTSCAMALHRADPSTEDSFPDKQYIVDDGLVRLAKTFGCNRDLIADHTPFWIDGRMIQVEDLWNALLVETEES